MCALPCNAVLLVISNFTIWILCKSYYKEDQYKKKQPKKCCLKSWQTNTPEQSWNLLVRCQNQQLILVVNAVFQLALHTEECNYYIPTNCLEYLALSMR